MGGHSDAVYLNRKLLLLFKVTKMYMYKQCTRLVIVLFAELNLKVVFSSNLLNCHSVMEPRNTYICNSGQVVWLPEDVQILLVCFHMGRTFCCDGKRK